MYDHLLLPTRPETYLFCSPLVNVLFVCKERSRINANTSLFSVPRGFVF
jgi:hypothetical protein